MLCNVCQAVDEARRAAEELTACPPDEGHAETAAAMACVAVAAARALGDRAARKMQRLMGVALRPAADSGAARTEEEARYRASLIINR